MEIMELSATVTLVPFNRFSSDGRLLAKLIPTSPNCYIRSLSLWEREFQFLTSAASIGGTVGVAEISQAQSLLRICKWPDNRKVTCFPYSKLSGNQNRQHKSNQIYDKRNQKRRPRKGEQHLWKRRDSTRSGEKALSLVRIVSELPNEREAVYGALDKWTAWETEFPLIAVAKALRILKKHNQWLRLIQVAKWMLSKGQGTTMRTYDTLLLAFDMDTRVDEAASLWNMLLHTHTRSISKQLFSRMISLYDHHNMPVKIIEIFGDMEELGVRPDEDTVRRVGRAFKKLGHEDKQKLVLRRYMCRWKYIHFNGETVRVPRKIPD